MSFRRALTAGVFALLLLGLLGSPPGLAAVEDVPSAVAPKQQLEAEKLREEVAKLERENEGNGLGDELIKFVPLITALVAVIGIVATLWKQVAEQSRQRKEELKQRETESQQRRIEAANRLEDRFAAILTELGSEKDSPKASAAAALATYLEPQHERFHRQVRLAVLTNLKLTQEEAIRKLFARVYVQALRSKLAINQFERDLSHAKLANTDLTDLALAEADLAFADLSNSDLAGCDLFRARGHRVDLHGARLGENDGEPTRLIEVRLKGANCREADFSGAVLVNAHMKEAKLEGAKFFRCHLQAAHFEGANLTGARFEQADLADTYFTGATLDATCLKGISRARRWRDAHFDPGVTAMIEAVAA